MCDVWVLCGVWSYVFALSIPCCGTSVKVVLFCACRRGTSVLEQVRPTFGKHCTLLSINSVAADGAAAAGGERSFLDPWSRILQRESHTGGGGGGVRGGIRVRGEKEG